ncbi:MAG: hypothetical protein ACPGXY_06040 [Alphaproteobacteria bacterium]
MAAPSSMEKHKFTPSAFEKGKLGDGLSDHDAFVLPVSIGGKKLWIFNLNLMAGLGTRNALSVKSTEPEYVDRLQKLAAKISKIVKEYGEGTVFTLQEISLGSGNSAKYAEVFLGFLSAELGIKLEGVVNFMHQNRYGSFIVYNPEKFSADAIAPPVLMESLLTSSKRQGENRPLAYSVFKVISSDGKSSSVALSAPAVPNEVSELYALTGEKLHHTQFSRSQAVKITSKEGLGSMNILNVHLMRNRDRSGIPNKSITGEKHDSKDGFFVSVSSALESALKEFDVIVGDFNLSSNPGDMQAMKSVSNADVKYLDGSHLVGNGERRTADFILLKK